MKLYGHETAKAIQNFGEGRTPYLLVKAYVEVKKAALRAIQEYEKRFDDDVFNAITTALDEIRDGKHNDQFLLDLRQGGAGTSFNMNSNEVISSLASIRCREITGREITLDPIEDINRFQSTNDTFPTALTIYLLRKINEAEQAVIALQEILVKKETEYDGILMTGRTEMQDALPMTLGQLFASWAGMIERDRWRINKVKERLRTIPLGGTAIGTSFAAPQKYIFLAEKFLREATGLPLSRSQNLTDEISSSDKYSELANCARLIAENVYKITGDLLIYTSSFVGELEHAHLQYGSTIMPAKKNPVILEFARGLSIDIQHNCAKISSYASNSQLQLNPYMPFIAHAFEDVFDSLFKMIDALTNKFFISMTVNASRIEENLSSSKALINALLPVCGYNRLKELYLVIEKGKPRTLDEIKMLLKIELNLSDDVLDSVFDRKNLTSFLRETK